MKNVKVLVFALAVLALVGASFAGAQTPYVGVFSDRAAWDPPPGGPPLIGDGLSEAFLPPGPAGAVDSLYIVAYNFNCLVTGIDVQVTYPPEISWIADLDTQPVTFGTTPAGMSMGWAIPQDGFQGVNIATVLVQWNITSCSVTNVPIPVSGHPLFNPTNPQYSCFNQVPLFNATGLTGLICPTVPVEESTWGKVKSLYTR